MARSAARRVRPQLRMVARTLLALAAAVAWSPAFACSRDGRIRDGQQTAQQSAQTSAHSSTPSAVERPRASVPPASQIDSVLSDSLSVIIERQMADSARPTDVTEHEWHHVQRLYRAASYAPLWTNGTDLLLRAKSLILALAMPTKTG